MDVFASSANELRTPESQTSAEHSPPQKVLEVEGLQCRTKLHQ